MTERHDDTRRRLLEAAGGVFAEKGFQAATVREICSRAGANVAAVNYYFGDKHRLYVEVVRFAHHEDEEQPLPNWPPGTPPAHKLRDFIEQMLANLHSEHVPPWCRRLMIREMAEPTEACVALMDAFVRPRAELLQQILGELLPPRVPEVDRHLIASSIVGQCLFHRVHRPIVKLLAGDELYESFTVARLADHITRFSLAALGYGPGIGEPAASAAMSAWESSGDEAVR